MSACPSHIGFPVSYDTARTVQRTRQDATGDTFKLLVAVHSRTAREELALMRSRQAPPAQIDAGEFAALRKISSMTTSPIQGFDLPHRD